MDKGFQVIITGTNLRYPGGPYPIVKRYMNGVILGQAGHCHIACFNSALHSSVGLRPLVGALNAMSELGWVWPGTDPSLYPEAVWRAELRDRGMLDWRRLLAPYLVEEDMVKLAIEDYSLDDLNILRDRAWYAGRSLRSPLWRVYALVPARLWETSSEFPHFDGQVRSLDRFGAIYDPSRHELVWK